MADLNAKASGGSPASETTHAIEVQHIVKKYGEFTAVDDVSFHVSDGEIFGLLGPNGAGKSRVSKAMMSLKIPMRCGGRSA